jgi:hypothetical protein
MAYSGTGTGNMADTGAVRVPTLVKRERNVARSSAVYIFGNFCYVVKSLTSVPIVLFGSC